MKRLRSFKSCIDELGGSAEWWRQLRNADPAFPKSIRGLWDFKALEQYLDNLSNLKPKSINYGDLVAGRLRGDGTGAVSSN
jgi:hypothetical protein